MCEDDPDGGNRTINLIDTMLTQLKTKMKIFIPYAVFGELESHKEDKKNGRRRAMATRIGQYLKQAKFVDFVTTVQQNPRELLEKAAQVLGSLWLLH